MASKLEMLAIRHAEISAEIKTNKDQIAVELGYCNGGLFVKPISESGEDFSFLEKSKSIASIGDATCLHYAYETCLEFNKDGDVYDDRYSYDEVLSTYGCRHCNSARRLKKHIGELGREKGRIHSAITNIGKSIAYLKDLGND